MQKILKPIYVKEDYHAPIAAEMIQRLYDVIFKPIFDILNVKTPGRVNSPEDIKKALRAGRIYWQEGYFYGEFNAIVGRALRGLGATFDRRKRAYKLDLGAIPMDMRTDIVIGKGMNKLKTERVMNHLDLLAKTKIVVGAGNQGVAIMDSLNEQVAKTVKVLPESIEIPYDLMDKSKRDLWDAYSEHVNGYLNDWKDEQILRLREKTEANAAMGYRADRLAQIVKSEFGVSQGRAKLIARQEASIFVSKYRETRYTDAGAREYIWSTSNDERVRKDHKDLNGMKFSWTEPPVTNKQTGARHNPGEDYGCRCLALPIIRIGAN